jgi:Rrf2 family nitric oxide-sensitive transcriptional repressor
MQLTRFTDYSLRVLIYLGLHPKRLVTIGEIKEIYNISEGHLMKIVNKLATLDYIETIRGKGGGMRLAAPPDRIIVGKVVRDTEENLNIVECFDPGNQSCPLLPSCTLQAVLIEGREGFLNVLDRYTLADLIRKENRRLNSRQKRLPNLK